MFYLYAVCVFSQSVTIATQFAARPASDGWQAFGSSSPVNKVSLVELQRRRGLRDTSFVLDCVYEVFCADFAQRSVTLGQKCKKAGCQFVQKTA